MVAYVSDQGHPVTAKACKVAGIPSTRLRILPTRFEDNYSLRGSTLEAAIKSDLQKGLIPFYVCVTIGTTTSGTTDNIQEIRSVLSQFAPKCWLHGDAAWAGAYGILPECRSTTTADAGLLDSYSTNAHKQLLTNFDCTGTWFIDRRWVYSALSFMDAEYLKNAASDRGAVVDYKDWQLVFGRRFRALKLWIVFRSHGLNGLKAHLRHGIQLAEQLKERIIAEERNGEGVEFSVQNYGLVLFRLYHSDASIRSRQRNNVSEHNKFQLEILENINKEGKIFLVHSTLSGRVVLRLALGGFDQTNDDINFAWNTIKRHALVVTKKTN